MQQRLPDHLNSAEFKPNGQLVAVGVLPAPDGDSAFVVLKIERCIDATQADWIARKAGADLHVLLGANPTEEVALLECYQEPVGLGWTAAIVVELTDRDNAEAFAKVVTAYADPGPEGALH